MLHTKLILSATFSLTTMQINERQETKVNQPPHPITHLLLKEWVAQCPLPNAQTQWLAVPRNPRYQQVQWWLLHLLESFSLWPNRRLSRDRLETAMTRYECYLSPSGQSEIKWIYQITDIRLQDSGYWTNVENLSSFGRIQLSEL